MVSASGCVPGPAAPFLPHAAARAASSWPSDCGPRRRGGDVWSVAFGHLPMARSTFRGCGDVWSVAFGHLPMARSTFPGGRPSGPPDAASPQGRVSLPVIFGSRRRSHRACWRGRAAAAIADEEPGGVQAHGALGSPGRWHDSVRIPTVRRRRCSTRGRPAEGRLCSQPCGWLGGGAQPGKATAPGTDAQAACLSSRGLLARGACSSGSRWRKPGGSSRRS